MRKPTACLFSRLAECLTICQDLSVNKTLYATLERAGGKESGEADEAGDGDDDPGGLRVGRAPLMRGWGGGANNISRGKPDVGFLP